MNRKYSNQKNSVNILDIAKKAKEQSIKKHAELMKKAYEIREKKSFQAFYARGVKENLDRINEELKKLDKQLVITYEPYDKSKRIEAFFYLSLYTKSKRHLTNYDMIGIQTEFKYTKFRIAREELYRELFKLQQFVYYLNFGSN